MFRTLAAIGLLALAAMGLSADSDSALAKLRSEAEALKPLVQSQPVRRFLSAAADLPSIAPRTLHQTTDKRWLTDAQAAALPESDRAALKPREFNESFYYNTRYGTPIAYARPLDLLFAGSAPDSPAPAGLKILDFGYGGIGHLRLLASLGANVTGVEVDSLLPVLYGFDGDQGAIAPAVASTVQTPGRLRLVHGRWPADTAVIAAVGSHFDLIISKNVLKNGYIHPAREVDPKMLVNLGVDDEAFLRAVFAALKPGGRLMVFNISPAPSKPDEPYIPWSDGRFPFQRELCEKVGFKVIAFDADDSAEVRRMAHALGWDQGEKPMNLESDLFAHYTILQRPES